MAPPPFQHFAPAVVELLALQAEIERSALAEHDVQSDEEEKDRVLSGQAAHNLMQKVVEKLRAKSKRPKRKPEEAKEEPVPDELAA